MNRTADLRQVGDQRRGDDRTDAAHPAHRLLDGLEAPGQRRDDRRQAFPNDRIVRQIGAAAFRLAGVDELPAPGGQRPQALIGAERRGQIGAPDRVGEIAGDQHRVD